MADLITTTDAEHTRNQRLARIHAWAGPIPKKRRTVSTDLRRTTRAHIMRAATRLAFYYPAATTLGANIDTDDVDTATGLMPLYVIDVQDAEGNDINVDPNRVPETNEWVYGADDNKGVWDGFYDDGNRIDLAEVLREVDALPDPEPGPWAYSGNYDDLDQVAHLWDAYVARYNELVANSDYPFDDSFRGRILTHGEDQSTEDTAIYLLQETRYVREWDAKIDALYADGYVEADRGALVEGPNPFACVVVVDRIHGRTGRIAQFPKSRLVVQDGKLVGVMPFRARTMGSRLDRSHRVLVKD